MSTYYHVSPMATLTTLTPQTSDNALRGEDNVQCVSLCADPLACLCLIASGDNAELYLYETEDVSDALNCGGMWDDTDDHFEYRTFSPVAVRLVGKVDMTISACKRALGACAWQMSDLIERYRTEDMIEQ